MHRLSCEGLHPASRYQLSCLNGLDGNDRSLLLIDNIIAPAQTSLDWMRVCENVVDLLERAAFRLNEAEVDDELVVCQLTILFLSVGRMNLQFP